MEAQVEPDSRMDSRYNSYGATEYPLEYTDSNSFPANKVSELGDRWWQWIASLNNITDPNPFTDLGQAGCDVGLQDDGRLFFLVGSPRDPDTGDFPVQNVKFRKTHLFYFL